MHRERHTQRPASRRSLIESQTLSSVSLSPSSVLSLARNSERRRSSSKSRISAEKHIFLAFDDDELLDIFNGTATSDDEHHNDDDGSSTSSSGASSSHVLSRQQQQQEQDEDFANGGNVNVGMCCRSSFTAASASASSVSNGRRRQVSFMRQSLSCSTPSSSSRRSSLSSTSVSSIRRAGPSLSHYCDIVISAPMLRPEFSSDTSPGVPSAQSNPQEDEEHIGDDAPPTDVEKADDKHDEADHAGRPRKSSFKRPEDRREWS